MFQLNEGKKLYFAKKRMLLCAKPLIKITRNALTEISLTINPCGNTSDHYFRDLLPFSRDSVVGI